MVDKLIGHTDLERARARNNQRAKFGENTKAMLKNMKWLSAAGEVVRVAMTHEVGIDLLSEMRMRRAEDKEDKDAKEQKRKELKIAKIESFVKLKETKQDESN